MALLFPWATKEYLLWHMTIGQIVLYHNTAMDIRNGKPASPFAGKSGKELKAWAKKQVADADDAERHMREERETRERKREELRSKWGQID